MYRYSNGQLSLADFRQPVGMHLNEENRWVKKAQTIPWPEIEKRYATLFTNRKGNVAEPLRLALGACIIQAEYGYSDEETALQIQKNPHLPQARPNGLSEIRQMPQTYCKDDSQSNREAALLSETGSGSDRKQTCSWKSPDQQASRASAYAPHHLRAAEVHVRQSHTQCSGSHCQHQPAVYPPDRPWQGGKAGGVRSQAGCQCCRRLEPDWNITRSTLTTKPAT